MAAMDAHEIAFSPQERADNEVPPGLLAYVRPASPEAVRDVLAADESSDDGRSPWVWLTLTNGDLPLATFPQGGTYLFALDNFLVQDNIRQARPEIGFT